MLMSVAVVGSEASGLVPFSLGRNDNALLENALLLWLDAGRPEINTQN